MARGEILIRRGSTERICEMIAELTDPANPTPGTIRELSVWVIQEGLTRFDSAASSAAHPSHRKAVNDVRRALCQRLKTWRKRGARIPQIPGESASADTMEAVFRHFGRGDDDGEA